MSERQCHLCGAVCICFRMLGKWLCWSCGKREENRHRVHAA